jgi:DNA-binding transcriptional ArsR family regulator
LTFQFDILRNIVVSGFTDMLAALGQPVRLRIFRLLVRRGPEGSCVEEIRRRVRIPGSTLSHHLDTLARCGLLAARREGRFIRYAVDWSQTRALLRFLLEDCCAERGAGRADGAAEPGPSGAEPGNCPG